MSVCLEPSVIQSPVNNGAEPSLQKLDSSAASRTPVPNKEEESNLPHKGLAKLLLTTIAPTSNASLLQKVATSSVITVVNTSCPLTLFKTLCPNTGGSSAQFSLVNSAPINVSNAIGKPITVVAAPTISVVKTIPNIKPAITQLIEESRIADTCNSNGLLTNPATDRPPIHNVFVKNSVIPDLVIPSNSHMDHIGVPGIKTHVLKAVSAAQASKIISGQCSGGIDSNKIKFVGNVMVSSPTSVITSASNNPSNIILNKSLNSKPFVQQKIVCNNSSLNGTQKFVNKNLSIPNNVLKPAPFNNNKLSPNKPQKILFPTHKSQIKTIPQINNNVAKPAIKTLSPQTRNILTPQAQRNGLGLRTAPPQRPKVPNKANYIGKHAIQAQKFRNPHGIGKLKNIIKPPVPSNNLFPHRTPQNTGVTYHQALTANIIQSLTENTSGRPYDFSTRYDSFNEARPSNNYSDSYNGPSGTKPQSNLEALSFVCQAVLLDHNYNATPPSDTPSRPVSCATASMQLNGVGPASSFYSPPNSTRNRTLSLNGSTNTLSTLSSTSTTSIPASTNNSSMFHDDDAASDISCGSERKAETEGEETDTAPEAEAVGNEDHYGDYVTRCICGFLHDDGYMIECDKCKVWQHVRCVIKSTKKLPEDYYCEICDPTKPIDRGKARTCQQQWMRDNQDIKFKKESRIRDLKIKEVMSDSDTSEDEPIGEELINKNRIGIITRRKSENSVRPIVRSRRDSLKPENVKRTFKKKERKIIKKKPKLSTKSQSEDELPDTWPTQTISQMPQLRQWIEHYEEAVTNHYSPELRARISSIRVNGVYSDASSQLNNLNKCRVFTQPLTSLKYLVTTMPLLANAPVVELRGKYMLSNQHRSSVIGHTGALTTRQHAQRPGPFLFFYRLPKENTEVCVDTRTYGNDARFIRRSCKPNSELKHCIEKGVLHLYVVTLVTIEVNVELTIAHEVHDLEAAGTTHISCACAKPSECTINKPIRKNGETTEMPAVRKRRGRRTASAMPDRIQEPAISLTRTEDVSSDNPTTPEPPVEINQEIDKAVPEEVETKENIKITEEIKPKEEVEIEEVKPKEEPNLNEETLVKEEVEEKIEKEIKKEEYPMTPPENILKDEDAISSPSPPLTRRLSLFQKGEDPEDKKELLIDPKKKSREERKIEAYMKAFERMERLQQRRQEHQARQAHRRESEPSPQSKDDEKQDTKMKRHRRKGRARTISTTSQSRCNRVNSADSCYGTSGDECLLSPTDSNSKDASCESSPIKDKRCSLSSEFSNCNSRNESKSPVQDVDYNSNCANSPDASLSSACLLVAAAVEPLEQGFKFPKTKKGMMNEWLNKSPEEIQQPTLNSSLSAPEGLFENSTNGFFGTGKGTLSNTNNICDGTQLHCNAKKRWLRQAISEDQSDSPIGRPDSPPLSEMVAPPKKRRLPRESISNDNSPPTTPCSNGPAALANCEDIKEREDRVEIVTANEDGDSPTQVDIDDASLKDRVAEMQQEIGSCFRLPSDNADSYQKDPRLAKAMLNNSEHLVATVERNLTILGFGEKKTGIPTKRKLSINEYRQRKQLSISEKMLEEPPGDDFSSIQSSVSLKTRPRSDSTSSSTSFLSSDDEMPELPKRIFSAFNSEPTELEKQRECVSLRLKKAFGLSINQDRKTALNMNAILNCDLGSTPTKKLFSPTFPIPGSSSELSSSLFSVTEDSDSKVSETRESEKCDIVEEDILMKTPDNTVKPEMFYTPDDEERDSKSEKDELSLDENEKCCDFGSEGTSYVPPFNNPFYPNSNFTSFGSVIDDAPYEGRNPSPPPDLNSALPVSYSSS